MHQLAVTAGSPPLMLLMVMWHETDFHFDPCRNRVDDDRGARGGSVHRGNARDFAGGGHSRRGGAVALAPNEFADDRNF